MSNLTKYFQGQKRLNFGESKNKENNLSFRNIAANSQVQYQGQVKANKVNTSFRSICNQSSSFYNPGEDLQEELNYVGGCVEHPHKRAEYFETISQKQYCKLCAAQLASLGYKLEKSEHFVCRDISPSGQLNRKKQSGLAYRQTIHVNDSRIKQTKNTDHIPVKFSTIFSQKSKPQNIEAKYHESEKIIDEFMNIYSDEMDQVEELINDIRIKNLQYIKNLKAENFQIYQDAKYKRQTETEYGGYDLFGKSLLKDNNSENVKFKIPSEEKIQKLSKILQALQEISSTKQQSISGSKIPLIKSICSNSSGKNTKDFLLKNSSSVSNLSSKSNFKKEKKEKQNSNKQKFGSEINHTKHYIPKQPIESSRFSSNSAILRKKNNQTENQMKTQSGEMRRRNTEMSLGVSNSCEDTPQSIKSKISSNSFVLPRNAAVTMFEKINVCESIDVRPQFSEQEANSKNIHRNKDFDTFEENEQKNFDSINNRTQIQSSYANKSGTYSVASKGRKSFHRYQNLNNQE